jgi:hypothetical protein
MSAQPSQPYQGPFGPPSVKAGLTSKGCTNCPRRRRKQGVENDSYLGFCARIIRAAGRRVSTGDVDALPDLIGLQAELDQALAAAVLGLREFGYSWGEIASRLGTSRQAAQQRWGGTT